MIARVTLEIALRREFDYLIPAGLEHQVEVGTRVQVPFGPRKVLGVVTALVEQSDYSNLKPLIKVIGTQSLVTPKVLQLARWMAEYYCCAPEVALKSVLPEAVRREQSGWRERLHVRALPARDPIPKLTKRQQEVWNMSCRCRNWWTWPKPPPPPCVASRTKASSPSAAKCPSATPTRMNISFRRNRSR